MKRIIIEILKLTFYLSILIYFPDDIKMLLLILLLILYSYNNRIILLIFLIMLLFISLINKIILASLILLYLILNKIIKKKRYYSLIIFIGSLLILSITYTILNQFTINNLYSYLLILLFYLISNLNIKYYKNTSFIINPTLFHLLLSLCYLTFITIYSPNDFLYSYFYLSNFLLFNNLYILLLSLYSFLLYYAYYHILNLKLIYQQIYGVFPVLFYFNIDYSHLSFIYFIILIPIMYIPLFLNKRNNIIYSSVDSILYVLDDYSKLLNKEVNNIEINKKLREERLNEINNTICSKCNKNTPCKLDNKRRIPYLASAIAYNDNNIYNCPNYSTFYLKETNYKPTSFQSSFIAKIKEELSGMYYQEVYKTKEYNKLLNTLSFYSIEVLEIKSLDISSLFLELKIKMNQKINADSLLLIIKPIFKENISILLKNNLLYIFKQPRCKIIFSHRILTKNDNLISGDNYFIKRLPNESMIFALSDGMGNGHKAYKESTHTLELLKRLLEYNLSIESTLSLLGNISNLRLDYDSYATLDLLKLNLSTMQLYLYKIGSTSTYLIRGNDIFSYENHTLPLNLDVSSSSYNIEFFINDIILLMSDGIADFITKEELFNLSLNNNPDVIIDNIITYIQKKEGNILKDDASIIAIKIKPY